MNSLFDSSSLQIVMDTLWPTLVNFILFQWWELKENDYNCKSTDRWAITVKFRNLDYSIIQIFPASRRCSDYQESTVVKYENSTAITWPAQSIMVNWWTQVWESQLWLYMPCMWRPDIALFENVNSSTNWQVKQNSQLAAQVCRVAEYNKGKYRFQCQGWIGSSSESCNGTWL